MPPFELGLTLLNASIPVKDHKPAFANSRMTDSKMNVHWSWIQDVQLQSTKAWKQYQFKLNLTTYDAGTYSSNRHHSSACPLPNFMRHVGQALNLPRNVKPLECFIRPTGNPNMFSVHFAWRKPASFVRLTYFGRVRSPETCIHAVFRIAQIEKTKRALRHPMMR